MCTRRTLCTRSYSDTDVLINVNEANNITRIQVELPRGVSVSELPGKVHKTRCVYTIDDAMFN